MLNHFREPQKAVLSVQEDLDEAQPRRSQRLPGTFSRPVSSAKVLTWEELSLSSRSAMDPIYWHLHQISSILNVNGHVDDCRVVGKIY